MTRFDKSLDTDINLQSVLDALTSHIAIIDEKSKIIAVNHVWRKFGEENGLRLANAGIGADYLEVCNKAKGPGSDEAAIVAESIRKVQRDEIPEAIIIYPCHSPTEQRWFQLKIAKFTLGKGNIILIHQNISARKIAEESLHESESKFRSVVEQSSEGIVLIDPDGRIIDWNHSQEDITGLTREYVLGRYVWDVQAETGLSDNRQQFAASLRERILVLLKSGTAPWAGKTAEVEISKPDGSQITMESVVFSIKHNHGYMACAINRDITELKKAQEAQLLSESKYRSYVKYSPVIAIIVDRDGKIIDVNPEASRRIHFSEEEFKTKTILELIPKEIAERSNQMLRELLEKGSASGEIQIITKEKQTLIFSSNAVVLPGGEIMIMCSDITDLKQTHTDLKASEALLNNILDNIPSLITVKDAKDFTYVKVNQQVKNYFQRGDQDIIGKTPVDIFIPEEAKFFSQNDHLVLEKNAPIETPRISFTTKDRQKRVMQEKKILMYDEKGKPLYILSVGDDITEKVHLEEKANARLARLEAISQLSTRLIEIDSLETLYPTLLEILQSIFNAPLGCIWLFNVEKNVLIPVYHNKNNRDYEKLVVDWLKPGEGIPGHVFSSQKPYIVHDYVSDPLLSESKREVIHSRLKGILVPLRTTNSVIGVVNIADVNEREFSEDDVKLLVTLSENAANAIQNIWLKEQTEQRLMQISAVSTIDRAISSSLDLKVTLEILVGNVISLLKVDAVDVLLFNPHSKLLEFSSGKGFRSKKSETAYLQLGESFAGKAALNREMVYIKDVNKITNLVFTRYLDDEEFITYFGIPLIAKGQLKGVLEVFKRSILEPDEDWLNFFRSLAEQASIAIDNAQLFENLHRSNIDLSMAYNATIEGWSRALDLRDKETEGHTQRVTELTERLARAFHFPESEIKFVRWGALLHDIGKMGVPDEILLKPGPLTEEEWVVMRLHPRYAFDMLSPIGYLSQAIDIPYCHHEKWDGTGYPRGLKGEQIPLSARIFAVVDIWDALCSDRPYRKAWPVEKVLEHIKSLSGTHLDPKVVDFCLKTQIFTEIQN